AVDDDGFASDVVVGDKERDDVGDLLGRAFAMERNAMLEIQLFAFGRHVGVKAGANDAGGDAVDADVVVGQIAGERASELRNCAFGRSIGNGSRYAEDACGGRDGNDAAFFVLTKVRE